MSKPELQAEAPKADDEASVEGRGITRSVPLFCALRSGQTKPDALQGKNLGEVMEQVQRQVRVGAGAVPIVYIYQLVAAERYLPFSETLTPEQVMAMQPQAVTPPETGGS